MSQLSSIDETLKERGNRYGKFEDHARIAQLLQTTMYIHEYDSGEVVPRANWYAMPADSRQALTVIADKIARILNGDPEYDDNWRDIAGYATLVLNRITGEKNG